MKTDDDWRAGLTAAKQQRPQPLVAHTYLRTRFVSISHPALLACSGGVECVVKRMSTDLQRAMVNDQVMGRIGGRAAAPVGTVELVDVPRELIDAQPEIKDFEPGVSHGSRYMNDISKQREVIMHIHVGPNRKRFAELALLYGLALCPWDHQFFYQKDTNLVFSIDHGHFFPNGPNWSVAGLQAAPAAIPDPTIEGGCHLTAAELKDAQALLERITDEAIVGAIAAVPDAWGLTEAEQLELAKYLHRRREEIKTKLAA